MANAPLQHQAAHPSHAQRLYQALYSAMPSGAAGVLPLAAGVPLPVPGLVKPKAQPKAQRKAQPKARNATPKARAARVPKPRARTGRAPAARAAQGAAATCWAAWPEERDGALSVRWAPFADGEALGALVCRVRGLAAGRVALRTVGTDVAWTWRVGDALPAELAPGAVVALA